MYGKPWETWGCGTIVKWIGSMWIITNTSEKKVNLLSLDHNRSSATVTDTWPDYDKGEPNGLECIEYIAPCMKDYLLKCTRLTFPEFKIYGR